MINGLTQIIGPLVFVIILIFLASYIYKKRQRKSGLMSLVEYTSIGPKKGVAALKVGKEILILGVTPTNLGLLKTFKDENFSEYMEEEKTEKKRIGVIE